MPQQPPQKQRVRTPAEQPARELRSAPPLIAARDYQRLVSVACAVVSPRAPVQSIAIAPLHMTDSRRLEFGTIALRVALPTGHRTTAPPPAPQIKGTRLLHAARWGERPKAARCF